MGSLRSACTTERRSDADAASHVRPGGQAPSGREGRDGARSHSARPARGAARLPERAVRRHPEVAPRRDRRDARPCEDDPPRLDRRPPRGRRASRARRRPERRQVVTPAGALEHPDQDRRLRVHDDAPGRCGDRDRRGPCAARRDSRPARGCSRGSGRRPRATRCSSERRRDGLLPRGVGSARDPGGAPA